MITFKSLNSHSASSLAASSPNDVLPERLCTEGNVQAMFDYTVGRTVRLAHPDNRMTDQATEAEDIETASHAAKALLEHSKRVMMEELHRACPSRVINKHI
jgi:hypothetical protein